MALVEQHHGFWQNRNKDASSIQRWQREQIEDSQYDVKNQSVPQVVSQPSRSGDGQIAERWNASAGSRMN
jgi:hypothetical protein